jgi:hypothetical protein
MRPSCMPIARRRSKRRVAVSVALVSMFVLAACGDDDDDGGAAGGSAPGGRDDRGRWVRHHRGRWVRDDRGRGVRHHRDRWIGGVGVYRQICDDVAAKGYEGFAIT